jgi:hypothetical protein
MTVFGERAFKEVSKVKCGPTGEALMQQNWCLLFYLFYCVFVDRVSLCSPGWHQTLNPLASLSQMLGLQGMHVLVSL